MIPAFLSPATGRPLQPDTPHSLADGSERWPVIDGIAYLRAGRETLAVEALAHLDRGDEASALVVLLADQDDWWDGGPPASDDLAALVRDRDSLSLRDAMRLLAFGRVGDYFAHRWTDPVFTAGLALIEAHWAEPRTCFELACGIGHYLRELAGHRVAGVGADVVFAKLWLARHWVVGPSTELVCFDAGRPWPIADVSADLVLCQDAFYFLEPKAEILNRLRTVAEPRGTLIAGHIHNREAPGFSSGRAVTAAELADLFPNAITYDDRELTRAAAEARGPVPASLDALRAVDAFSLADGPGLLRQPQPVTGRLTLPRPGSDIRLNPLYRSDERGGAEIAWPSDRYRAEYGSLATYPARSDAPAQARFSPALADAVRRRELVSLPERW